MAVQFCVLPSVFLEVERARRSVLNILPLHPLDRTQRRGLAHGAFGLLAFVSVATWVAGLGAVRASGHLPGLAALEGGSAPLHLATATTQASWRAHIESALGQVATRSSPTDEPPPSVLTGAAPTHDLRSLEIAAVPTPASASLHRRLRQLVARLPARASASVHVRDLRSGQVLFDHAGEVPRNPASTQKLLTAAAAIELLGPDYRFETRLHRAGGVAYLVGEGDPSLLLADLYTMVSESHFELDPEPIHTVIVDDSAFSDLRFGPGYAADGPDPSYLAPSSACSANFNTVEVVVSSSEGGANIQVTPRSTAITVEDRTARTGGPLRVHTRATADGEGTVVVVQGRPPRRGSAKTIRRRVLTPSLFTGGVVANLISEIHGQPAPRVLRGSLDATAPVRATHQSRRLVSVLRSALTFSNNFTMEQVLRTLAWRATSDPGTWTDGVRLLKRYWRAIGGDDAQLVVVNGAGLSREGRIDARGLVSVVAQIQRPGTHAHLLASSMARPGAEGTLHGRLADLGPDLIAKTGTLARSSALAGMVLDEHGERPLGFAVLVEGAPLPVARAFQDNLARALYRHLHLAPESSPRRP